MVNYSPQQLDRVFSALSDSTRRSILTSLARGESTVTELARPYSMSLPAVSKHLKILEAAGLIARSKDGRIHRCRLEPAPMKEAAEWIAFYSKFWEDQLESFATYLESTNNQEDNHE